MIRFIFQMFSFFLLVGLHEATDAAQNKPSIEEQKKLERLQPTLKQILEVDSLNIPWGFNLERVFERGDCARKQSLDKYDFSSRITLLQKHKSKAKKLSEEYASLSLQIKKVNEDADQELKKISTLNLIKKHQIEQRRKASLQPLQASMTKVEKELKDNSIIMRNHSLTISKETGLPLEQIAKVPDYDGWKKANPEPLPRCSMQMITANQPAIHKTPNTGRPLPVPPQRSGSPKLLRPVPNR